MLTNNVQDYAKCSLLVCVFCFILQVFFYVFLHFLGGQRQQYKTKQNKHKMQPTFKNKKKQKPKTKTQCYHATACESDWRSKSKHAHSRKAIPQKMLKSSYRCFVNKMKSLRDQNNQDLVIPVELNAG